MSPCRKYKPACVTKTAEIAWPFKFLEKEPPVLLLPSHLPPSPLNMTSFSQI